MAARQFVTSVTTSATVIQGTQYPSYILKNNHSATIFLGDSTVTTANGFPLEAGDVFSPSDEAHKSLTGKDSDRLFGIVGAATADVRVLIQQRINVP
jgi:hypothetical protein